MTRIRILIQGEDHPWTELTGQVWVMSLHQRLGVTTAKRHGPSGRVLTPLLPGRPRCEFWGEAQQTSNAPSLLQSQTGAVVELGAERTPAQSWDEDRSTTCRGGQEGPPHTSGRLLCPLAACHSGTESGFSACRRGPPSGSSSLLPLPVRGFPCCLGAGMTTKPRQ